MNIEHFFAAFFLFLTHVGLLLNREAEVKLIGN